MWLPVSVVEVLVLIPAILIIDKFKLLCDFTHALKACSVDIDSMQLLVHPLSLKFTLHNEYHSYDFRPIPLMHHPYAILAMHIM